MAPPLIPSDLPHTHSHSLTCTLDTHTHGPGQRVSWTLPIRWRSQSAEENVHWPCGSELREAERLKENQFRPRNPTGDREGEGGAKFHSSQPDQARPP